MVAFATAGTLMELSHTPRAWTTSEDAMALWPQTLTSGSVNRHTWARTPTEPSSALKPPETCVPKGA